MCRVYNPLCFACFCFHFIVIFNRFKCNAKMQHTVWQLVILSGKSVVISGNERPHLFPELGRSLTCPLLKDCCKVGFLVESQAESYLRNSFICCGKKVFCLYKLSSL